MEISLLKITYKKIISIIDELIPRSQKFEMPYASEVVKLELLFNQLKKDDLFVNILPNQLEIKSKNSSEFKLAEFKKLIEQPLIECYFSSKKVQTILDKKKSYFLSQNEEINEETVRLIENNKNRFIKFTF